jgi:hypothetical protein
VSKLPDFKPVFPRWEPVCPSKILPANVTEAAKDLFKVFFLFLVALVCMRQSHIVKVPHIPNWHIFLSH